METSWNFLDTFNSSSEKRDHCLIVLNQEIQADAGVVISLWKRAALKVLVDGGSNRWLSFLEKNNKEVLSLPDAITGDFDSVTPATKAYFASKGVVFVPTPDQDETDFTKAFRYVKKVIEEKQLKVSHALALCETSGRLDQIIANLETLHHAHNIAPQLPLVNMSSNSLSWLLLPGSHSIAVTPGHVSGRAWCGLVPLSGPTVVTTRGLKWDLDNGTLAFGSLVSTSNTFEDTTVRVTCDKPLVWTMEFLP